MIRIDISAGQLLFWLWLAITLTACLRRPTKG
jgi:hypothetical protein